MYVYFRTKVLSRVHYVMVQYVYTYTYTYVYCNVVRHVRVVHVQYVLYEGTFESTFVDV